MVQGSAYNGFTLTLTPTLSRMGAAASCCNTTWTFRFAEQFSAWDIAAAAGTLDEYLQANPSPVPTTVDKKQFYEVV